MTELPTTGLVLVGYRGTGKSTVGRIIAARAGRPFVDADEAFESRFGRTIREVFEGEGEGEAAFRDREAELIAELAERSAEIVLATGGGAILRAANRAALRRLGFVAWLVGNPTVIADRLRADARERPALTAAGTVEEVAAVLAAREPLYRDVADVAIPTDDRTPEDVAAAVLDAWRGAGR